MSNPSLKPEMLISRLSYRPRHLLKAMITITIPPKPPVPTLANRASSLGILDRLPPEIISTFLDMLDIQSIAHFACVSFQGNTFVQLQRAYQDLVIFAPQMLLALGKTGLIDRHHIATLYAALRSEQCTTCVEYGAFLFLPTCKRCCWECLRYNPLLRALLPREAKRYFGLSKQHLQQLPVFHVIPGNYGISANPTLEQHCQLVSVQAAKDLGLTVHGSAEKLAHVMAKRCKSTRLLVTGQYLQDKPAAVSQGQDLVLLPSQGNIPTDNFFGMASIPFPSLSESGIEDGLWCKGCEVTLCQYDSLRLPRDALAAIVPADCEPQRVLLGLERRARSKKSFLDHIKHCYGAQQLVPELATGND